ncbi:MAG: aspartyl protease family protein [Sphingorhabdus sp.]|nr:aspartyl protease family protein [Sphingorhabdus sp.]
MFSRRFLLQAGLLSPILASPLRAQAAADKFYAVGISIEDNRIWTAVSLGKLKPELFIIDTGSERSVVSHKWATANKLKTGGYTMMRGMGGVEKADVVKVKDMLIGGVFTKDYQEFAATKSLDRADFVGLLGVDFLLFADCDLDFVKGEWRVYPEGRTSRPGFYQVPDSIRPRNVAQPLGMAVSVGDFSGYFGIDTGSPSALLLDGKAAKKTGLWESDRPYAPFAHKGFGSGSSRARIYRADRIKLHKFILEKQLISLLEPGVDKSNWRDVDGLVGMQALRHFHLSTDTKNKALWMAPNGLNFANEERYPLSGLWLEGSGTNITIADVGIGSPAAATGLKVGDKIVGQNFAAMLQKFSGAPGKSVSFDYERDGKRASVEYTLRPYL